jgi:hypothetical protein
VTQFASASGNEGSPAPAKSGQRGGSAGNEGSPAPAKSGQRGGSRGLPRRPQGRAGPAAIRRETYSMTASMIWVAWALVLAAATSRAPSPMSEVKTAA